MYSQMLSLDMTILNNIVQATTIVAILLFIKGTAKIQVASSLIEPENITHEKIDCAPKHLMQEYKNPTNPIAMNGRIK